MYPLTYPYKVQVQQTTKDLSFNIETTWLLHGPVSIALQMQPVVGDFESHLAYRLHLIHKAALLKNMAEKNSKKVQARKKGLFWPRPVETTLCSRRLSIVWMSSANGIWRGPNIQHMIFEAPDLQHGTIQGYHYWTRVHAGQPWQYPERYIHQPTNQSPKVKGEEWRLRPTQG